MTWLQYLHNASKEEIANFLLYARDEFCELESSECGECIHGWHGYSDKDCLECAMKFLESEGPAIIAQKSKYHLEACPFCKQIHSVQVIHDNDCAGSGYYAVNCNFNLGGCGATCGYAPTEEEAVEKWNKRGEAVER